MAETTVEALAVWIERFKERQPGDAEDDGYNHAIDDVVRELRTPTPGSELAPPIVATREERERLEQCLKGDHDWQHWTELGQFLYGDGPRPGFESCKRCDLRRGPDGSLTLPKWRLPEEIDWSVAPTSVGGGS